MHRHRSYLDFERHRDFRSSFDRLTILSKCQNDIGRYLLSTIMACAYRLHRPTWSSTFGLGLSVAQAVVNLPLAATNYRRNSRLYRELDRYAIHVCAMHEFAVLGLEAEAVSTVQTIWRERGKLPRGVNCFHFVVRKPWPNHLALYGRSGRSASRHILRFPSSCVWSQRAPFS